MIFFFFGSSSTTPGTPGIELTGQDLVKQALQELGVLNATENPNGEDATFGLAKLNRLFDLWNADPRTSFATTFDPFDLVPNTNPHTIGPDGDWETILRPPELLAATLIVSSTLRQPITLQSREWWLAQTDRSTTSDMPTDGYYDPSFPEGRLYLWPVPSTAYQVELASRGLMAAMSLTDRVQLAPGYADAVIKTLAETLAAPMRVSMPDGLMDGARRARAIIFAANRHIPDLVTRDAGMPGGCGGAYDFRTGRVG